MMSRARFLFRRRRAEYLAHGFNIFHSVDGVSWGIENSSNLRCFRWVLSAHVPFLPNLRRSRAARRWTSVYATGHCSDSPIALDTLRPPPFHGFPFPAWNAIMIIRALTDTRFQREKARADYLESERDLFRLWGASAFDM